MHLSKCNRHKHSVANGLLLQQEQQEHLVHGTPSQFQIQHRFLAASTYGNRQF